MLRWDGRGFERAVFYDDTSEPSLVWGRAPDDLWVAGPVGTALHFDGRTWDTRPLPTSADVVSLAGGGDAEVWAQDASGVVWRWRGGAWARGETRPVDEHRGLWIMGPDDAWACGDGVASHWDGARWTREVVDRMPSSRLCAVWSDGDAVWFSDGTFVRRRNRDAQWDFESETSQVTAVGGAPDDVWLGRQDGVIQRISEGRFVGVTRTRPRFDVTRLAGTDDATLRALTPATLMSFDGRAWFEAAAPTRFYKTGIVFLAWLNGHQSHFAMVGGQQSARSLVHLAELFRLADAAGLFRDPDEACARMRRVLAVHGLPN